VNPFLNKTKKDYVKHAGSMPSIADVLAKNVNEPFVASANQRAPSGRSFTLQENAVIASGESVFNDKMYLFGWYWSMT